MNQARDRVRPGGRDEQIGKCIAGVASETFKGPVLFADTPWVGGQVALDKDGGVIALAQGTVDQRLLPLAPIAQPGFDARLNETGSLLYATGIEPD